MRKPLCETIYVTLLSQSLSISFTVNYTGNRGASKQSNYDYDRHAAHSDHMRGTQPDESWFKRFERVTKMLYAYDQTNNGTLPYNMAEEKVCVCVQT